jgi:hypothetical protein
MTAHDQRLVEIGLDEIVRVLDDAVLVRLAGVDAGGLEVVVIEQLLEPPRPRTRSIASAAPR